MTYGAFFDKNKIDTELKELETQMQDANFWNDQNNAKRITQQVSFLKDELDNYHNLNTIIDELDTFEQILQEEWSEELFTEALKFLKESQSYVDKNEIKLLLNGKYDRYNAILTIHLVQEALSLKTGQKCFCACLNDGLNVRNLDSIL